MGQELIWFVLALFSVIFYVRGRDRKVTSLSFGAWFWFADTLSSHHVRDVLNQQVDLGLIINYSMYLFYTIIMLTLSSYPWTR
jgi:hypothetical protein